MPYANKEDRNEYFRKRRAEYRQRALDYMGGECEHCGWDEYPEVLEFHHIDPDYEDRQKVLTYWTRSWKRTVEELDICALLCPTCHRLADAGLIDVESDRNGA